LFDLTNQVWRYIVTSTLIGQIKQLVNFNSSWTLTLAYASGPWQKVCLCKKYTWWRWYAWRGSITAWIRMRRRSASHLDSSGLHNYNDTFTILRSLKSVFRATVWKSKVRYGSIFFYMFLRCLNWSQNAFFSILAQECIFLPFYFFSLKSPKNSRVGVFC